MRFCRAFLSLLGHLSFFSPFIKKWDTAGQERFRTITTAYYRGAGAILAIFSPASRRSFESLGQFTKSIRDFTVAISVVANHINEPISRVVDRSEAEAFAKSIGADYFECNCRTGEGIDEVFFETARKAISLRKKIIGNKELHKQRAFALCMALHQRLGQQSPASCCSQHVLQWIMELVPLEILPPVSAAENPKLAKQQKCYIQ